VTHRHLIGAVVVPLVRFASIDVELKRTNHRSYRFANMDALKEIARVLKPTAVFGMIWNIDDCLILSSLLHH
jgi:hypothetical protein